MEETSRTIPGLSTRAVGATGIATMSQSSSAPMSAAIMTSGATKEQEETAMTGQSSSAFWGAAVMTGMPPAPNGKEEAATKLKR